MVPFSTFPPAISGFCTYSEQQHSTRRTQPANQNRVVIFQCAVSFMLCIECTRNEPRSAEEK